jgi:uncharacterized coiled-coil protein SlyX
MTQEFTSTPPISTEEAVMQARRQLEELTNRLAAEVEAKRQATEAAKSPLEKRVDLLERRLAHLDGQMPKLGGHSYLLYE